MADAETLKLAEEELNRLIMVYRKQGLSTQDILAILLTAYTAISGALPRA